MKKRHGLGLVVVLLCVLVFSMTAFAAQSMTVVQCAIAGDQVVVIAQGTPAASDDGQYYLFALQPYEGGIGARTDFCATAPAAAAVQFNTTLNLNTAASKLYCRFVVAAKQGGAFVPISNEMYITNPEAVATVSLGQPARSNKGLIADWRFASDLTELNCGYATYVLDISRFFQGAGVPYTYNGKSYSFNGAVVNEYDTVVSKFTAQGCNVVMVVMNNYNNGVTPDLLPPLARGNASMYSYGFNVQEQIPTEKLEALMSFLSERYSGKAYGSIHSWIIGNEVNNNSPAHYMGNMTVDQFAADYAKQFRVCYNAIVSHNKDAVVYTNIDQRWNFLDASLPLQYPGKTFLDNFAANIKSTGDINWGLSFHPHPVPMDNCQFWKLPGAYAGLRLIDASDNSKMASVQNMEVFVNHMKQPALLAPNGTVRPMIITELGFTSTDTQYATDENIQAAALAYAYKKACMYPEIRAFIIHKQIDDAAEVAAGHSYGLRTLDGRAKQAYLIFQAMDVNPAVCDFALPYIGATSWSQLGIK